MKTTLYVLTCVALTALFLSCVGSGPSPEQNSALINLQESIAFIVKDGIVEPAELEELAAKIAALRAAPAGPGVGTMIGATLGTLALTIYPALRAVLPLIPNRYILGTDPDPEVARVAAGLPAPGPATS